MSAPDPDVILDAVHKRQEVLASIDAHAAEKRELAVELDVSRSTVNRAVNELEEFDLVCETDDGYRLTAFGGFAYRGYRSFMDRYDAFVAAKPLFAYLPDELPVALELVDEAEVIRSEPPAPEEPLTRLEDVVRAGESVEGTFPVVTYRCVELFETQARENEARVDLSFDEECLTYLTNQFHRELSLALELDNWTVRQIDDKPPLGLVVVDDERFWLGAYDEDGGLKGAFVGEADGVVAWARNVLDRYREEGRRLRKPAVQNRTKSPELQ
jgi:predicted transcriptional regulator